MKTFTKILIIFILEILFLLGNFQIASAKTDSLKLLEKIKEFEKEKKELIKLKDSLKAEIKDLKVRSDYWSTAFSSALSCQTAIFSIIFALATFFASYFTLDRINRKIEQSEERTLTRIGKIEKDNANFQYWNNRKFEDFKEDFKNVEIEFLKQAIMIDKVIEDSLSKSQKWVGVINTLLHKLTLVLRLTKLSNENELGIMFYDDFNHIDTYINIIIKDKSLKIQLKELYESIITSIKEIKQIKDEKVKYKCYELQKSIEDYLGIESNSS